MTAETSSSAISSPPVNVAAIDAGSNAIRLVIAQANSASEVNKLDGRRLPVRLGHRVFTEGEFDTATISQAVEAFLHFQSLMERHQVREYRAVATSACRESRNAGYLVERIRRESGIRLEIIDPAEEVRLISQGVTEALGASASPELIMDLGGGSLDVSWTGDRIYHPSLTLPIGTVRLIEKLGIDGAFDEEQVRVLRERIESILSEHISRNPDLFDLEVVLCGGNAEALAELAPGRPRGECPTLDMFLLGEMLWKILKLDVGDRMKAFGVSRDRAEVMGVAAVVFTTLGRSMRLREALVPGVGVREGVLRDLVASIFGPPSEDEESRQEMVISNARRLALRFVGEQRHLDQVRKMALTMFDQLASVHGLDGGMRLLLEVAAVLHDVGHGVGRYNHHRHGEYIVTHSQIPGLTERELQVVACLVRYHTGGRPKKKHPLFARLEPGDQEAVRKLASILKIAERLDSDHKQAIEAVTVTSTGDRTLIVLDGNFKSIHTITDAKKVTGLFERVFGLSVVFATQQ